MDRSHGSGTGARDGSASPYGNGAHGTPPYGDAAYGTPYGGPGGYGEAPYGPYPYPPPSPRPRNDGLRAHAIVALVVSVVMALSCYVTLGGIPAAIMSGIALSKVETDPARSRRLLTWSWICLGVNIGLVIIGFGALIWAGLSGYLD